LLHKLNKMIPNEYKIEFIDEIATQLTEAKFNEDCYYCYGENEHKMTEEAKDLYNKKYNEIEALYTNLIQTNIDTSKEIKLNMDEILYLQMILNSNVEEINVWNKEEQDSMYADMIKKLYNKIIITKNK
jgi:hypothetical protein